MLAPSRSSLPVPIWPIANRSGSGLLSHTRLQTNDGQAGPCRKRCVTTGSLPTGHQRVALSAAAASALRELLSEGLVRIWEGKRSEKTQVPPHESDEQLRASEIWTVPDGPHVFLSSMAAGEARVTLASPLPRP
jgi:hypothetical protein